MKQKQYLSVFPPQGYGVLPQKILASTLSMSVFVAESSAN